MEQLPAEGIIIELLVAGLILGLLPMLMAWHHGRPGLARWSYIVTVVIAVALGFLFAASFAGAVTALVMLNVWRHQKRAQRRQAHRDALEAKRPPATETKV